MRELALQHLALRLRPVNRALHALVRRQAEAAARLARPELAPVCIMEDDVRTLLARADALFDDATDALPQPLCTDAEQAQEADLRTRAAAAGGELPLDALARLQGLSAFEQLALVACAAPELDRSYERIFGYVLDDLNRCQSCVELLCALGGGGIGERLAHRAQLGAHGRLRRTGMLRAPGEAASELRQPLRLGDGMLECLCGGGPPAAFADPDEVDCADAQPQPEDADAIARLARGLRDGAVAVVGVWGPARDHHGDVAKALARAAGKRLRRLAPADWPAPQARAAIDAAAAGGALLWVPLEAHERSDSPVPREQLAAALAAAAVPVLLTGNSAWRPLELLAARAYAELRIAAPTHAARQRLWSLALPELAPAQAAELASRFRVGAREVRACALAARASAQLAANGHGPDVAAHVQAAGAAVLRPGSQRYATVVEPRRGPADLVLPPALHRQVLEIADFHRVWAQVAEDWGYQRLLGGRGGIKALFTGEPGTGKTLAAEVVAGRLGMPLLKIDLSQVVSKWVGETEQHLEALFREAEDSHGVLFFDEADALFGKRGEVQHGVDRYANLEVSYLLQRLEEHAGVVILASNLKDNIDHAFLRRFHVSLHFPRPEPRERRRLWEIAFPPQAPLADDLALDVLARLDLTGAGITAAARTAALLAAAEGGARIASRHVAQALARQYQREARLLMPSELGPYAALAREAP